MARTDSNTNQSFKWASLRVDELREIIKLRKINKKKKIIIENELKLNK